jgi:glycosidase
MRRFFFSPLLIKSLRRFMSMRLHVAKVNPLRGSCFLAVFALSIAQLVCGVGCVAQSAKPVITKIDPPNWFTELPDSLLLVHGEHLENTAFAVKGGDARITKTTISPNGHWAFLMFATSNARPGMIEIDATNAKGSTVAPYVLSARRSEAEQPKGFSSADVMYLIMPDRFADGDAANDDLKSFRDPDDRSAGFAYHGGDLRGITDHLDYLKQMGVTTIWTTPLYDNSAGQSGQTYHGYSATDMYAVDPHFGSMEDYRALVVTAHARGMKVVLDTVPNHVGPAHPWAKDMPTPDWLHGTVGSHIRVDDDFKSVTDAKADPARRQVLLDGWFADILPDLNQDNPYVAQYLAQNAIWWIESAGLDGLRIDTFPYVPRSFWQYYNGALHTLYPQMTDVGEVFNGDAHITSFFAGGRANAGSDGSYDTLLDTPFDYPMYFALRGALTHHRPMSGVADILRQDTLYPHPERLVIFLGNHDTKRFLSEDGASPEALRLGFGLLATLRGMPQLYYGDEIGMKGGSSDPDNRKDFPGGFPKDKKDAFTDAGRSADQEAMHHWVESLMQLRAQTPVLQSGQLQVLLADKDSLAFVRNEDAGKSCTAAPAAARYFVVANNSLKPQGISVPIASSALNGCMKFTSALQDGAMVQVSAGTLLVRLPGEAIGIFRAEP